MMDNKKPNNRDSWLPYLLSFLIPAFVVFFIYVLRELWPLGDSIYLRSDMYHQYAPFHKELWRKIHEGGSLFYSWDIGMGINFWSLLAYYLASPTNLLLLIVPESMIAIFMDFIIMVKIGLCGLTCCIYLSKHFRQKHYMFAAISTFYALSSYTAAFCWNLMWWDCIILLPLIFLGIERLVNEKKCFLYVITLGLAIFSNYYIGIMLCIGSVIYFLICLASYEGEREKTFLTERLGMFALFSLLAGGLAACMILPEYNTLMLSPSADSTFPTELKNYFSVFDMISRALINVEPSVFMAHEPNLYCGTLVFLCIPLYLMSKTGNRKEKTGKIIFLAILLVSFNMNIPNYIWHGLHFPNSLACRESFIYIFLLLTMSAEAILDLKNRTANELAAALGGAVLLFLVLEKWYVNEDYSFTIIYLSIALACLYAFILNYFRKAKKQAIPALCISLMIVTTAEAAINIEETGFSTTSYSSYHSDNEAIENLLEKAQASEDSLAFYRTEKLDRRSKNDAAWHGYHGISTFVSTSSAGIAKLLSDLGMEESFNSYSNYGATPVTNALFDVGYLLHKKELSPRSTLELFAEEDGNYLYKNPYRLSLAYAIPSGLTGKTYGEALNPFMLQNELIYDLTGIDNVFLSLVPKNGTTATIPVYADSRTGLKECDVFFLISSDCKTATARSYDKNGSLLHEQTFHDLGDPYICHVGLVPDSGYVEVSTDTSSSISMDAYYLNLPAFEQAYEKLSESQLTITSFKDTRIEGKLSAKETCTILTSIPFDPGWTVYVDETPVDTAAFRDALLCFDVDEGEHVIRFSFTPKGWIPGITITLCSVFVLFLLMVSSFIIHSGKKKQAEDDNLPFPKRKPERPCKKAKPEAVIEKPEEQTVSEMEKE